MPQGTGRAGEDYAALWLENHGYRVVGRNYHSRYGEIDIIAENAQYIVFVEVKTRQAGGLVSPEESVTRRKQEKLLLTAQQYLARNPTPLQPRFDLAAVTARYGEPFGIKYYENAFGA